MNATGGDPSGICPVGTSANAPVCPHDPGNSFEMHYDVTAPGFTANPFPAWEALRTNEPVWWWEDGDTWIVTSYEHVTAVLTDGDRFSASMKDAKDFVAPDSTLDPSLFDRIFDSAILIAKGDDHARLRKMVSRGFTPRGVRRNLDVITAEAERLLAEAAAMPQPINYMTAFARRFPPAIMGHMLGVPTPHHSRFAELSDIVIRIVDPKLVIQDFNLIVSAIEEMVEMITLVIGEMVLPEHEVGDDEVDIMTHLAIAESRGELTHDEVLALLIALVIGSTDTTRSLLGNGLLALLTNPAAAEYLTTDTWDRLPRAVDEMLRWAPISNGGTRWAMEDVELNGRLIRKGETLMYAVGAGNRDTAQFAEPDEFDPARSNSSVHLSFGKGSHHCLGASLARLEAQVVFAELISHYVVAASGEPEWVDDHPVMREMSSLPVTLTRRP